LGRFCTRNVASTDQIRKAVWFKPNTSIEEGVQQFAEWDLSTMVRNKKSLKIPPTNFLGGFNVIDPYEFIYMVIS